MKILLQQDIDISQITWQRKKIIQDPNNVALQQIEEEERAKMDKME